MVPSVIEERGPGLAPRWLDPRASAFPSWTRADESEDENEEQGRFVRRRFRTAHKSRIDDVSILSEGQRGTGTRKPTPVKRDLLTGVVEAGHHLESAVVEPLAAAIFPPPPKNNYNPSSDDGGKRSEGEKGAKSSDDEPKSAEPANNPPPPPSKGRPTELFNFPPEPTLADPSSLLEPPKAPELQTNIPGNSISTSNPPPPLTTPPAKPTPPPEQAPPPPPQSSSDNQPPPPPATTSELTSSPPVITQAPPETKTTSRKTLTPVFAGIRPTGVIVEPKTPTLDSPPIFSLSPVITGPAPAVSSDARKGVGPPPTAEPALGETATTTFETQTTATSSIPSQTASPAASKGQGYHHHGLSPTGEKALMAVGSVGGAILLAFVGWLIWRYIKKSNRNYSSWQRHLPSSNAFEKPKGLVRNVISGLPFMKKRTAQQEWDTIDDDIEQWFNEKRPVAARVTMGNPPIITPGTPLSSNPPGIAVRTVFTRRSEYEGERPNAVPNHAPNQSISSTAPQINQTLRSDKPYVNIRASDISSLSSGFGDGDIAMPSAARTLPRQSQTGTSQRGSVVDDMQRRRDTISTQASEDSTPRFRTVNSWVRQQSGRVKRANQRQADASDAPPVPELPLEQDFRLMMPDGEIPRPVDDGHGVGEGYGMAK